jgi:hypothetical protein
VVNIHREGLLLGPTLASLRLARDRARAAGFTVETVVVADRPDALTLAVLSDRMPDADRVVEVDFGDLGAAREHGIRVAAHDWVFLHDGDDLFSSNWYESFFRQAAAGRIDPRVVYHTEIFARFGTLLDLRRMIDSADPLFNPLFLASEWYFSNKHVVHRGLFEAFPLPRNNIRTGLGNEDWTWSCHTIRGGIRHSLLPETICFYRVKPVAQSLGLTPGMIHGPSPLFAPESIAALGRSPPASLAATGGRTLIADAPLPPWFWAEVERQGAFESAITEFRGLPPRRQALPLANLNYNVAAATAELFADLDDRPKIWIFATTDSLRAAGPTLALILEAAARYEGGAWQPVLMHDGTEPWGEGSAPVPPGAVAISTSGLKARHGLGDWYFSRFLMRPLVQHPGAIVLDLGSAVFRRMFAEFHRTVIETARTFRFLHADPVADLLSPVLAAFLANGQLWRRHTGTAAPVTAGGSAAGLFRDPGLWALTPLPEAAMLAFEAVTPRRHLMKVPPPALDFGALIASAGPSSASSSAPISASAQAAPPVPPGFEAEAAAGGAAERLRPRGDRGQLAAYRSASAWVHEGWFADASRLLTGRPDMRLVLPSVAAAVRPDGRHLMFRIDPARPADYFAWLHELPPGPLPPPLLAMVRGLPERPAASDLGGLLRSLHAHARTAGCAAVLPGSVAIATDRRPQAGAAAHG